MSKIKIFILGLLFGVFLFCFGATWCKVNYCKAYQEIDNITGAYSYSLKLNENNTYHNYSGNYTNFYYDDMNNSTINILGNNLGLVVRGRGPNYYEIFQSSSYGTYTSSLLAGSNARLIIDSFSFNEMGTYRINYNITSSWFDEFEYYGYNLTGYIYRFSRSSSSFNVVSTHTLNQSGSLTLNINTTTLLNYSYAFVLNTSDLYDAVNSDLGLPNLYLNVTDNTNSSSIENVNGAYFYYYVHGTTTSTSSYATIQLIQVNAVASFKLLDSTRCYQYRATTGGLFECYAGFYVTDLTQTYQVYVSSSGFNIGVTGETSKGINVLCMPVQYIYDYSNNSVSTLSTTNRYFANSIVTTWSFSSGDLWSYKLMGVGEDITGGTSTCVGGCGGNYISNTFPFDYYGYVPLNSFNSIYNNSVYPFGVLMTTNTNNSRFTYSYSTAFYSFNSIGGGIEYETGGSDYEKYKKCDAWYDIPCQLSNGLTYVVYKAPIISPIFSFANGLITTTSVFFNVFGFFDEWSWLISIISIPIVWLVFKKMFGGD